MAKSSYVTARPLTQPKRNEPKTTTGEDTYAGALRAPRAGSPDVVFASFRFGWVNKPGSKGVY